MYMPSGFIFAFVTSVAPSAAKMLIERAAKTSGGGVGDGSPIRSTGRNGPIETRPISVPDDRTGGAVCVALGAGARVGDVVGVEGSVVLVAQAVRRRVERQRLTDCETARFTIRRLNVESTSMRFFPRYPSDIPNSMRSTAIFASARGTLYRSRYNLIASILRFAFSNL